MTLSETAAAAIAQLVRVQEDLRPTALSTGIRSILVKAGQCAECIVKPARDGCDRCSDCEDAHREEAGLCLLHTPPEPCNKDHLCSDCAEEALDGMCAVCGSEPVSDVGERCGSCRGDAMDHAYDAYRERGAA